MKKGQTYYYSPSMDEDFGTLGHNQKPLKKDYVYVNDNRCFVFFSWLIYCLLAWPILFLYGKIALGVKVNGKEKLRDPALKGGYFLYVNHTHYADAFLSHVFLSHGKRCYVVSHSDPVSIKGLSGLIKMLGILPLPQEGDYSNFVGFLKGMHRRCEQKRVIAIYPEGTLWPYYTGIRPFKKNSFRFPAKENKPVVVVSETYRKPHFPFHKPRISLNVLEVLKPLPNEDLDMTSSRYAKTSYELIKESVSSSSNFAYNQYIEKS